MRTSDKPDGEASYSRYRQIRQKCDEARDGIITMDQFTAYLQDLTHILETRAKAIYDNFEATNYYEDNSDEINVGLEGVQQYEAGVSELWSFASDGDVGRIDPALQLIWDGNQRIVEAMRINRENRAALADLWETLRAPE